MAPLDLVQVVNILLVYLYQGAVSMWVYCLKVSVYVCVCVGESHSGHKLSSGRWDRYL